jgi:hypothetical protein
VSNAFTFGSGRARAPFAGGDPGVPGAGDRPVIAPSTPRDPAQLAADALAIGARPIASTPSTPIPGPRPQTPDQDPSGPSPLDRDDDDAPRRPTRL